jgi:leucyl aminopeptidase
MGGPAPGTLTAGAFLRAFVDETPWIHLDIAGTAYVDTETAWQAKGPTGTPVRALISLIESLGGARSGHTNGSAKKTAAAK